MDTKQWVKLLFCVCLSLDFQNLRVVYENTPSLARSKNDTHIIVALARIKIFFIIHHTSCRITSKKGEGVVGEKVKNFLQPLLST
jgi:hypothetical protein